MNNCKPRKYFCPTLYIEDFVNLLFYGWILNSFWAAKDFFHSQVIKEITCIFFYILWCEVGSQLNFVSDVLLANTMY